MTSFLKYLKLSRHTQSASVAKERLQIIVAHERGKNEKQRPDYLPMLEKELLEVVRRYVDISDEQIKVTMDRDGECEVLELNIALPEGNPKAADN
jgi:cell division topological specificity factor